MKSHFFFITILLLSLIMSSCESSPAAPDTDDAEKQDKPTTAVNNPLPPQEKPDYSHLRPWKFSSEREVPTPAKFTVQVKGNTPPKKVMLYGVYAEQNYIADSTTARPDGSVVFEKANGYLSGLYYVGMGDNLFLQVLLDQDQTFEMETSKAAPLKDMKVKGNIDTELLYSAQAFDRELQPQFDVVNKRVKDAEFGSAEWKTAKAAQRALVDKRMSHIAKLAKKHPEAFYPQFKIAGQNPNFEPPYLPDGSIDQEKYAPMYRAKFWEGVDFGDVRLLRTPVFHNKLKRYMKELTVKQADSLLASAKVVCQKALAGHPEIFKHVVNWVAINYNEKAEIMGAEKVFVYVVQNYFTDQLGFWGSISDLEKIRDKAIEMQLSLLGMTGQDVRAKDYKGEYHSIYGLNTDYTVLFIYSTECDHCKEASPEMEKLHQEWKDKNVGFFGICIDPDKEEFQKFVEKYNFSFVNVFDPKYESQYYLKYHLDITPEIYILDPDHKIIAKNLQPKQVSDILEREMEE
jgi:peroxiredoxin